MEQEREKPKQVYINNDRLAETIQVMLAAGDIHVEIPVIRLIMQYQTDNYENLGIIKIV